MKEGRQFLKLDGPIGRKKYILIALTIGIYSFISSIVLAVFHSLFEVNKYTLILFIILWGCYAISILYTTWINFTKRLWDLFGDKNNAIFYGSAFLLANIAMSFIPYLNILGMILSFVVSLMLLFKKGKLLEFKTNSEENVA